MELRDFAIQVLQSRTLEEKLHWPDVISDECPGQSMAAPAVPGRPRELIFKSPGSGRSEFPGLHRLEEERERGRLLHFFANHELLATELMALVLLKFPDAPSAFRRDVLRTLKDEQIHTRLYLKRMEACGIHFGELPVSGFIWKTVSVMESPLDYVAGLSLTFEQANLDYCRHFAQGFNQVGDAVTARLLERIYTDEIGHVAHGLKWFRRWKEPRCTDWEAYCGQLQLPLTPNRAKGVGFNVEGRREAGLDPGFIDELNVCAHSKGRTPGVYCFNPFAELIMSQGLKFQPVKAQVSLQSDLENIPQFLCRQDDVVLVSRRPATSFLSGIKQAGFAVPEFVELQDGRIAPGDPLRDRKIGELRPWAWGPDSYDLLAPLFSHVTGTVDGRSEKFPGEWRELYSKSWSVKCLKELLGDYQGKPWLCSDREIGVTVVDVQEAMDVIKKIRSHGHHKVVLKKAYGLAGHDMIRLWEPKILEKQIRWIHNVLETGERLIVEPWLERVVDFSVQLEMKHAGLKLKGHTHLFNDAGGQFEAVGVGPDHTRKFPKALIELFQGQPRVLGELHEFFNQFIGGLGTELAELGFTGPVGVDAFAYRTEAGEIRLKPVVEINPRYTMGRLAVEMMKRVSPGKSGILKLINRASLKKSGCGGFGEFADQMAQQFPLWLDGHPVKKISRGALCMNDPGHAREYLAVFRVTGDCEL